jgi:SAM-dependent methyltransferase
MFARVARGVGAVDGWIQSASGVHKRRNLWAVNLLDVRDRMRVLEIGCGPGLRLQYAQRLAPNASFVGLDVSDPLLRTAAKRLSARKNVALQQGGIETLEGARDRFDRILAVDVPRTWPDLDAALACLIAALALHGQMVLCVDATSAEDRFAEELAAACTAAGLAAARTKRLHESAAPTFAVLGLKL